MTGWLQRLSLTIRPGNVGVFSSCVVIVVFGLSCRAAETPPTSSSIIDDLGRAVELDGNVQRIVSLSPATTELLFAIGAGDLVVGRTQWDSVPKEALAIPSVGEGMPPNVEAVAAARPELVVLYASEINRRPIEQLATLGIQSIGVKLDLLERLPHITELLGEATGLKQQADSFADMFRARLRAAAAPARQSEDSARVVILTWDNPPIVIGAGSFLHEMLTLAGARNAFADIEAPSASVSIESIADRNPDVFLVTTGIDEPAYATRPEWQTVPAVQQRRFAIVEGTEFQWPSLRSLDAVTRLRTAITNGRSAREPEPSPR